MNRHESSGVTTTGSVAPALSTAALADQNRCYRGSGGISTGNAGAGFRPAFLDQATGTVYPSCFADGRAAPVHTLDGLPGELVVERQPRGRVTRVRAGVIAGFLRDGAFYTREQAARALAHQERCHRRNLIRNPPQSPAHPG